MVHPNHASSQWNPQLFNYVSVLSETNGRLFKPERKKHRDSDRGDLDATLMPNDKIFTYILHSYSWFLRSKYTIRRSVIWLSGFKKMPCFCPWAILWAQRNAPILTIVEHLAVVWSLEKGGQNDRCERYLRTCRTRLSGTLGVCCSNVWTNGPLEVDYRLSTEMHGHVDTHTYCVIIIIVYMRKDTAESSRVPNTN